MENYVPKGHSFPDHDWWEEKKTDVSFLYINEGDSQGGMHPECIVKSDENWDDGSEAVSSEEVRRRPSKIDGSKDVMMKHNTNRSLGSKMQLDRWIEESRQEMKVPSRSTGITTLAGYVNIAYPIMNSLKKRKAKGSRPKDETKTKELQKLIQQTSINLQHASSTLSKIEAALDQTSAKSGQKREALKKAFHRKSTRIVESYELINVLMNMVKNAANIPGVQKGASETSRTFGSSVDLI